MKKLMEKERTTYELADSQKGIYFVCQENPNSLAYNNPFVLELPKTVDINKFEEAVIKVTEIHPALFAKIRIIDSTPVMLPGDINVEIKKVNGPISEVKKTFTVPFDFENGPLYHYTICQDQDRYYFLFDIHHTAFDGTSTKVYINQLAAAYRGEEIQEEEKNYFDYLVKEQNDLDEELLSEAREYFKKRLEGRDFTCDIISDVEQRSHSIGKVRMNLPSELSIERLSAFAKQKGVTVNHVFASAFSYALSMFTGSDEINFATASNGRNWPEFDHTVGMFVKTMPITLDIREKETVDELLEDTKEAFIGIKKYDRISFAELSREYGLNLNVSFIYQSKILAGLEIEGERILEQTIEASECPSDLMCWVMKLETGYAMQIQYSEEHFTWELMNSLCETFIEIVKGLLECKFLSEINVVSLRQHEFMEEINSTDEDYDTTKTVNQIYEEVVSKHQDKLALVYKENKYTYAQFDEIVKRIASFIVNKGIKSDEFVAILAPRNDEAVLGIWGTILSGAGFQVLDSTYPAERINYMLSDSKAKLLIANRELIDMIEGYSGDILYTDEIKNLPQALDDLPQVRPEDALTMIYTSGTTGKPKGCVLENRNLVAFHVSHRNVMNIDSTSRMALYASFGFDAGIMDVVGGMMAGAALFIIPDEMRLDLNAVENFYIDNEITHGFMTTQVGRMFAEKTKCTSLKAFMVGGEKLVPFDVQDSFKVINGYGPCETFAYICYHQVQGNSLVQPIGKPSKNTKLYVTDKAGKLLPMGGVGELCIAGRQVGREYLGLPEKTNEVFCPNPFSSEEAYSRMYKSGDVVRMLPTGEIEFIGRRDGQVKIRGFRVELTEIEEVIRRYEGVKDATLMAFDEASGGKYIAAYVTSDNELDVDKVRDFIASEKPDYMVPKAIMQIESIPYTQNQKVNKRALPVPEVMAEEEDKEAPNSPMEQKIFDVLSQIIGRDNFGINSDFFNLGLSSIGVLKFNSLLAEELEVNLSISDIRQNSCVKKLAAHIFGLEEHVEYEKQESYPVMQNQMGVFLECAMSEETLMYNIPALFKIDKSLDTAKLKGAVEKAINAHSYIKATIGNDEEGNLRIFRNDDEEAVIEVFNTLEMPKADELVRPFNLSGGRLYRAQIYETKEEKYLFIDVHHIISDGTSLGIFFEDISKAYSGEEICQEKFTSFDAALAEEENRYGEKYEKAKEYYQKLLSGIESDSLPPICPETEENLCGTLEVDFKEKSQDVMDYCKENNYSLNAFFNSVFGFVLSKYTNKDDLSYCTVYNGRSDAKASLSFGMLVKTLPIRVMLDEKGSIHSHIMNMQNQILDTMSMDQISFAELASEYSLKADIFFNYQGDNFNFDKIGGKDAQLIDIEELPAKAPLSFEVFLNKGTFRIKASYEKNKYCKEIVSSICQSIFAAAGEFIIKDKLSEVSIMSEDEMKAFDEMNKTDVDFERIPAHKIFEKTAKENGEKIAVRTRKGELTYKELNEKADKVAGTLVKLGVHLDEIVGLILDRSLLVPIGEIGVMKAGCAFLPMLPTYPDDRLEYCIKDAGCKYVLIDEETLQTKRELFENNKDVVPLVIEEIINNDVVPFEEINVCENNLAYCIYTSGSTGTPKGVMIEHHNLSNFVQTSNIILGIDEIDNIIAMASISFDMSMSEIFYNLCHGKMVYIATEEEIHDLDLILEAFTKNNIDGAVMTPSFIWNLLSLEQFEKAISNLKSVVLGAEAFQPALFDKLKGLNKDMIICNGYGPTECTQACSAKEVLSGKNITIGGPMSNVKFYVATKEGHLLPRYALGELMICGEGVGRGYVNLPEKNKAAFTQIKGVPAYHSGDVVRINKDNEAEFGGRIDNQIKIRGFRIELDEIENVMQEFEGIKQTKVIVRNSGSGDNLFGYFTGVKDVNVDELLAFMKSKLTYYMVPTAVMQLDKMPMTPNGKIDKKALPEINVKKKERGTRKPKKSLEEKITEIIMSVLNIDECYVDDNFFEIGGTSLTASKVVMQLKSQGYKVEYQDIFDNQTPYELAEYIEGTLIAEKAIGGNDPVESTETQDKYAQVLKYNSIEYANDAIRNPLGDVLLTGSCGFLGIHILKTLLEMEEGRIICLMRKGGFEDVKTRLKSMLVYYFENDFEEAFDNRITVVEGDITDDNLLAMFADINFDTLINSAASVKHFANDDSIEHVNVYGVKNLIQLAKAKNAKMIQISTTSVPGAHNDETYKANLTMPENRLFVVDDMNNKYCQSKYKAELLMLEAIEDGLRGKVIRVGNLMGRHSDGEFQTNMRTNAFLNGLRGFVTIGKCPISHGTDPMSFSPVDSSAQAIVLLAGTNDMFTAFNADTRFGFDEMKLIDAVNRCGLTIRPVPDKEYYDDFYAMMGDAEKNEKVSALLTNDRPDIHLIETENRFTANVLYRLGFSWPFVDDEYLEKVIKSLDTLDFFFR